MYQFLAFVQHIKYDLNMQETTLTMEPSTNKKISFEDQLNPEQLDVRYLEQGLQILNRTRDGERIRTQLRGVFESEEAQIVAERAAIQLAQDNDPRMLEVFRLLVPTDETFVKTYEELSSKYNVENNENLRVVAYLWDLTMEFWSTTYLDLNSLEDQGIVESKLEKIIMLATELGEHSVTATHQTRTQKSANQIMEDGVIYRSSEKAQYEGFGTYTGILGGFQNWGQEGTFTFPVALSTTLPIIVSSTDPEAMANVLAQGVTIEDGKPFGIPIWESSSSVKLHKWQVEMLRKYIDPNLEVIQYTDEYEDRGTVWASDHICPVVVISSEVPPIVWGSISRVLNIPAVIKKEDVAKYEESVNTGKLKSRKLDL